MLRIWQILATFLAFLTAFNIAEALEAILKLSASLIWLGAWWNFVVASAFDLLPIHTHEFERNAIALFFLAITISFRGYIYSTGELKSLKDVLSSIKLFEEKINTISENLHPNNAFLKFLFGTMTILFATYILVFLLRILNSYLTEGESILYFNLLGVYFITLVFLIGSRKIVHPEKVKNKYLRYAYFILISPFIFIVSIIFISLILTIFIFSCWTYIWKFAVLSIFVIIVTPYIESTLPAAFHEALDAMPMPK